MSNYCMNDIVLYSKEKKPLIRLHNQLKQLSKDDSYSYPIHRLLSSLEASYLVDNLDDLRHYILDFDSIDPQKRHLLLPPLYRSCLVSSYRRCRYFIVPQ